MNDPAIKFCNLVETRDLPAIVKACVKVKAHSMLYIFALLALCCGGIMFLVGEDMINGEKLSLVTRSVWPKIVAAVTVVGITGLGVLVWHHEKIRVRNSAFIRDWLVAGLKEERDQTLSRFRSTVREYWRARALEAAFQAESRSQGEGASSAWKAWADQLEESWPVRSHEQTEERYCELIRLAREDIYSALVRWELQNRLQKTKKGPPRPPARLSV